MRNEYHTVVFLQNAWKRDPIEPEIERWRSSPRGWDEELPDWYTAQFEWPRRFWKAALNNCKTGFMLNHLLPVGMDDGMICQFMEHGIWIDEATPKCGFGRSGVSLPADRIWMSDVINLFAPKNIVTCGKTATAALRSMPLSDSVKTIALPHPAHRVVTKALYRQAGDLLRDGFFHRVTFTQTRDGVDVSDYYA